MLEDRKFHSSETPSPLDRLQLVTLYEMMDSKQSWLGEAICLRPSVEIAAKGCRQGIGLKIQVQYVGIIICVTLI